MPQEQTGSEVSCSKDLAKRKQGRNSESGNVCGVSDLRQSLTATDLQPAIRSDNIIYDYVSLSI